MAMRRALALLLVASPVWADPFGGFSGVDRPYLANPDRVCQPLEVKDGAATGVPTCEKASADVIAQLSIKSPLAQRGAHAAFAATASAKVLTVTNQAGDAVVTWTAPDPIGKVVEVYASQYEDRVAVAYTTRSLGKEVTNVVAFEVVKTTGRSGDPTQTQTSTSTSTSTSTTTDDPKLVAAVKAKDWKKVLAIEPGHAEALYRMAATDLAAKKKDAALASIEALGKSTRADASEWQVEARFDPAFAALRADPKFRAAVGLDRPARNAYELAMGFGGQWEQTGTSCDKAEVKLTMQHDRTFKLRVKTACEGHVMDLPFHGTWRIDGKNVVLTFPSNGQKASAKDDSPCKFEKLGDEDALHCALDKDLEFQVLPTRR
jgi:hypothetical protein